MKHSLHFCFKFTKTNDYIHSLPWMTKLSACLFRLDPKNIEWKAQYKAKTNVDRVSGLAMNNVLSQNGT